MKNLAHETIKSLSSHYEHEIIYYLIIEIPLKTSVLNGILAKLVKVLS